MTIMPPKLSIAAPKFISEKAIKSPMPPGHRFNLYAPMLDNGFFSPKFGKAETLRRSSEPYDGCIKNLLKTLYERQISLSQKLGALIIPIKLTAPFAVGLGISHPVENGFSFLSPYGLPYIAGSGIKGVLRKAAKESSILSDKEIDNLFGKEGKNDDDATRGALIFWDGFPQCNNMTVEVMTPHQSDYYQGKSSPHDQGTPTPIQFLAVPANTKMNLVIQCVKSLLNQKDFDWQEKIIKVIEYASKWLGFGAKTSVGYGSFQIINNGLKEYREALKAKEEEKLLDSLSPEEREIQNANIELKKLVEEFEKIKATEKKYIANKSKLNPKLKIIYEICGKLKNEDAKVFLENIYKFVKENNNKKGEVRDKINNIFGQ